jgi:hypothetical protein
MDQVHMPGELPVLTGWPGIAFGRLQKRTGFGWQPVRIVAVFTDQVGLIWEDGDPLDVHLVARKHVLLNQEPGDELRQIGAAPSSPARIQIRRACECGCGRRVDGRHRFATMACRKFWYRRLAS